MPVPPVNIHSPLKVVFSEPSSLTTVVAMPS
jgi:hypothetical protein